MIIFNMTTSLEKDHQKTFIILLRMITGMIKRVSWKANIDLAGLILNKGSKNSELREAVHSWHEENEWVKVSSWT